MKALFVDFDTTGHHSIYLKALLEAFPGEAVLVLPEKTDVYTQQQHYISELSRNMSFSEYKAFIQKLKKLVDKEKPDVVHLVSGDFLYRYFGYGLRRIPCVLAVTFHHIIFSKIRNLSYKLIFRNINIGIVHTGFIYEGLKSLGIKNVNKVEYPYFEDVIDADQEALKDKYGILPDKKVLLAFGGTRYDKGLDLLLESLKQVDLPFHLMIAGNAEDFDEKYIIEHTKEYSNSVSYIMTYVDKERMEELFAMCDMVVLPYRKKFAGASGPLTTGVAYGKMIIGPDCNSIGDIIEKNHLGKVFRVEDVISLSKTISESLKNDFAYDNKALEYKSAITRTEFIDKYRSIYGAYNRS